MQTEAQAWAPGLVIPIKRDVVTAAPQPVILIFESLEELKERLDYWKLALRLQDWKISVAVVRAKELPGPTYDGSATISCDFKEARILIRDVSDLERDRVFSFDHEEILVHELLHVAFKGVGDDAIEQPLDVLAQCLVALDRKWRENATRQSV